jgi:hypothetical protein
MKYIEQLPHELSVSATTALQQPGNLATWRNRLCCGAVAPVLFSLAAECDAHFAQYKHDLPGNIASCRNAFSNTISVLANPSLQLVQNGHPASSSVVALGCAPLKYQWLLNRSAIGGATNDTLPLPERGSAALGSYMVIIGSAFGAVTSGPVTLLRDSNGNGLPDPWALAYFGNLNLTATGDFDGDGISDLEEYLEGTNPADANPYDPRLHLEGIRGRFMASPDLPHYTNGQVVTLTPLPHAGEVFVARSGSIKGIKLAMSVLIDGHKWVTGQPVRFCVSTSIPMRGYQWYFNNGPIPGWNSAREDARGDMTSFADRGKRQPPRRNGWKRMLSLL